ncbi:Hypothetical protein, putative [Bodo saltans]|uniref:Uncharacterized protein n=1 Tax=Bodo saltans TaxID=75058 RepID=A0A0S4KN40_BODSA|nr:Hypothetical protein, putative [Bodo saltans]|eukprot:CUI14291.1 Hypothetical protein, putative [Bodo saltans]
MHYVGHAAAVSFDRERLVEVALSVPLSADRLHLLRRQHRVKVRQQEAARVAARRAFQLSREKNVRNSVSLAGSSLMQPSTSAVHSPLYSPLWRTDGPFPTLNSSGGVAGASEASVNLFGDRQQSIEVLTNNDDYYGSGVVGYHHHKHDDENAGEELQEVFVPRVYEEETPVQSSTNSASSGVSNA